MCEPSSKIEKIIGLRVSNYKVLIFILLNFLTLFFINLLVIWYQKLKMKLIYEKCGVNEATHFGILGTDNYFYIAVKEELVLPNIEDSPLKRYCSSINSDQKIILFNFKLFKYIYIERLNEFVSLKFNINATFDNINKHFTKGLNLREVEYQKQIFGSCDLQIKIDSVLILILKEVSDPFYIFQIFSIILWYYNEYGIYASVILITSIFSIILGVYEVRTNLINIQMMAKYSCPVSIFRVNKVKRL
jgi:cation-transporting ATPase 13A3/4/5